MKIKTDKLEIEEELKNENIQKFHLTYNACSFLKPSLLPLLGQYTTTSFATQVLNDTFDCPSFMSKYT